MRTYELMIIHRPALDEADVRAQVDELARAITEEGGSVDPVDFWGKRRFTYEIDHQTEGWYSVLVFRSDPPILERLDRALSLADSVIRHKFVHREDLDRATKTG